MENGKNDLEEEVLSTAFPAVKGNDSAFHTGCTILLSRIAEGIRDGRIAIVRFDKWRRVGSTQYDQTCLHCIRDIHAGETIWIKNRGGDMALMVLCHGCYINPQKTLF